jgi:hypothetical protein
MPALGSPIEFKPQFNMVMTCNTLPEVPDNGRRIKSSGVWFQVRREPQAPNEFEMDPDLNEV